jgi:hypothetical protein
VSAPCERLIHPSLGLAEYKLTTCSFLEYICWHWTLSGEGLSLLVDQSHSDELGASSTNHSDASKLIHLSDVGVAEGCSHFCFELLVGHEKTIHEFFESVLSFSFTALEPKEGVFDTKNFTPEGAIKLRCIFSRIKVFRSQKKQKNNPPVKARFPHS